MGICVSASACVNGTTTTSGVAPRLPRPPSSPSNGGGSRGAFTPVAASVSAFAASVYSRAGSSGSLHRTTGGASHDIVQDSGLAYPSLLGRSGALATGPTSEHYRGSSSYGGSRGTFPAEQSADACLSRVSPHDAVHPSLPHQLLERPGHLRVGQSSHPFCRPHSAEDQLPTTFDTLQETNDFARIMMRAAGVAGGDVSSLSNLNDSAEHNLQYHLADSVLPPKATRDGATPAAHNGAAPPAFLSNPLMPVAMSLAAIKPLTTASTFSSHSTPPLSFNGRALKSAFVPLAPTPVNHSSQLRQPLRSPATVLDACHEPQFLFASVATLDGGGALVSLVPTAELTTGMHSSSQDDEEGEDETTTTNASTTNTTTTATQADPPLLNASVELFGATASSTWASQYRSIDIGSTMALVQRSLSCEV